MITSRQNPLVKSFRKLHQAKFRKQSQTCLLEGTNLVEAALIHHYPLQICCLTPTWRSRYRALFQQIEQHAQRVEEVSDEVLAAMVTTQHPDGVVALIDWPNTAQLPDQMMGVGLVLDSLQDPGNLGTILRSASAAHSSGVFLSADCVALTNPKVMRASVGAWFQVPTYCPENLAQTLQAYQQQGIQLVATTPTASQSYWDLDLTQPSLILIGNEGVGLSPDLLALADVEVNIPIHEGTESLNAAIAASLILFEGCRQRQGL